MNWNGFVSEYAPIGYDGILAEVKYCKSVMGLSYSKMSYRYKIPVRTLQNWLQGKTDAPAYVLLMLLYIMQQDSNQQVDVDVLSGWPLFV